MSSYACREPGIFDVLKKTPAGHRGEIQLTEAMLARTRSSEMYPLSFERVRLNVGNFEGLLKRKFGFWVRQGRIGSARLQTVLEARSGDGRTFDPIYT